MDFISNKNHQIQEMLESMGVSNLEELWQSIPKEILLSAPSQDDGLSECEGIEEVKAIGAKNTYTSYESYIGAGAYQHYVPSIVNFVISKSGFLTAYTPYQAEASQGLLQTIYEFQTCICRLTGLEMANASLYDGASACGEAMLMACRINRLRKKVLVAENIHPHYLEVVKQYVEASQIELVLIPIDEKGKIIREKFEELLDEDVAGLLLSYPNFFGAIEDVKPLFEQAQKKGIVNALCANPLAYGIYECAEKLGADIAVGDCQPFGIPLQLGGPYAGYLSCKRKHARQIPGRVVGRTKDRSGDSGFVLTLQTREQHIRREKATSNICSNQALYALASLVAMLWYGPKGISQLALTNFQRTAYLQKNLLKLSKVSALNNECIFNEFVVKLDVPIKDVMKHFRDKKIEPGIELGKFCPKFQNHLLINVTEMKGIDALNRYLEAASEIL
ncbi:MAG: putative glycine dehydrogenase (decarboxylating) subunit 1 [Chlamydiae bacterium]|nr:putative glycine dehydrogenase (decarboxylating) subunit 1 [Chlamydiota bacterium]